MRNFTKLSVVAASLMLAGNALAVDDVTEGSGSIDVTGHVPVNCTVTVGEGNIDMEHNPQVGDNFDFNGAIEFTCNAKEGSTISMESANCGLVPGGSREHIVDYNLWLEFIGLEKDVMGGIGGNFIEGVFEGGTCKTLNQVMTARKDNMLAMGNVTGKLTVELTSAMKFAGTYDDTLTISIAAKP